MTIYWITDEPWPTSAEVLAEADAAGAEQVLHGVPVRLAEVVPEGTTGLLIVDDEPAPAHVHHPLDPFGVLAALLACLSVISVTDASNATGYDEDEVVDEVLAWEAAQAAAGI
jgi:hypothetical protein